ncbi:MAG: hypothetical protein WBK88_06495, partial [Methanothrix sp.]
MTLVDEVLDPITLDRDFLAPGDVAIGFADRDVVGSDFPGPVVANASAAAVDDVGAAVTASATLALSFFENHLTIVKVADKKAADRGELVNYTIALTNMAKESSPVWPTNLVVEDVFNRPDELVNRVVVCGGYGADGWTCASNSSALEMKWLTCCLEGISVVKTAEVDPENPMAVRYRVDVENGADATRVATVTDHLPLGMTLISSSVEFSSYRDGVVVWHLPEIGPWETATIEFSALASVPGRFTNVVEVDARSVDGPVVEPVYVASVVQVGAAEECGPTGCGIWQPPAWEFQSYGSDPDLLACELLTSSAGCTSTGCPPAPPHPLMG